MLWERSGRSAGACDRGLDSTRWPRALV